MNSMDVICLGIRESLGEASKMHGPLNYPQAAKCKSCLQTSEGVSHLLPS